MQATRHHRPRAAGFQPRGRRASPTPRSPPRLVAPAAGRDKLPASRAPGKPLWRRGVRSIVPARERRWLCRDLLPRCGSHRPRAREALGRRSAHRGRMASPSPRARGAERGLIAPPSAAPDLPRAREASHEFDGAPAPCKPLLPRAGVAARHAAGRRGSRPPLRSTGAARRARSTTPPRVRGHCPVSRGRQAGSRLRGAPRPGEGASPPGERAALRPPCVGRAGPGPPWAARGRRGRTGPRMRLLPARPHDGGGHPTTLRATPHRPTHRFCR